MKNEFREQISFGCLIVGGGGFYLTQWREKPGIYKSVITYEDLD